MPTATIDRTAIIHQYRHLRLLPPDQAAPLIAALDRLTYVRRMVFEYRVTGRERHVDWPSRTAYYRWLDAPLSVADTALMVGLSDKYIRSVVDRAADVLAIVLADQVASSATA